GTIISQDPAEGADKPDDATIQLVMEAATIEVPSLIGLTVPAADSLLTQNGFELGEKTFARGGQHPGGAVTAQSVSGGDRALPGSAIDVTVEEALVRVPNVKSMTARVARQALDDVGLTADLSTGKGGGEPGTIIKQNPAANQEVKRGSAVALVVKEQTVRVPNLSGKTVESAVAALTNLGMAATVKHKRVTTAGQANKVIRQVPAANAESYAGSSVQLTVGKRYNVGTTLGTLVVAPNTTATYVLSNSATCKNAVQGKVAWDYNGSTRWNAANVANLCKGAETVTAPAQCFKTVMHGGVNWGGGTRWAWKNALDLCAGTKSASSRVTCFKGKIRQGARWQDAIPDCNGSIYTPNYRSAPQEASAGS
ncbi:MAG: PASTA domain-containing protein, partial [Pseudomonadota bacterium]